MLKSTRIWEREREHLSKRVKWSRESKAHLERERAGTQIRMRLLNSHYLHCDIFSFLEKEPQPAIVTVCWVVLDNSRDKVETLMRKTRQTRKQWRVWPAVDKLKRGNHLMPSAWWQALGDNVESSLNLLLSSEICIQNLINLKRWMFFFGLFS